MIEVIGPINVLIGLGYLARRFGMLPDDAVKALSLLTFGVVTPALLFRSMAHLGIEGLSFSATTSYFAGAVTIFALVVLVASRTRQANPDSPFRLGKAAVTGLGAVFSNTVMLGIPLIRLSHGQAGVGILVSIIALHALIMMSLSTFVVEFSRRSDNKARTDLWTPVKNSLLHPVTFPILLGLAWASLSKTTGLELPGMVDVALKLLGDANAPLSLLLLGASLNLTRMGDMWKRVTLIMCIKLLVFPALVYVLGKWVFDLSPLALAVTTLSAGISTGANVYLFAQRYQEEVEWASTLVTLSTLACVFSLSLWLYVLK